MRCASKKIRGNCGGEECGVSFLAAELVTRDKGQPSRLPREL